MADFYGTVEEALTYHNNRLNLGWIEVNEATQIAALIVASEWIDGKFRHRFRGLKTGLRTQIREWPRTGAYDHYSYPIASNEVPVEVRNATYEAALREIVEPGSLNTDFKQSSSIKSVSVDGAVSVTFSGAMSASDAQLVIPKITDILYPLLSSETVGFYTAEAVRG